MLKIKNSFVIELTSLKIWYQNIRLVNHVGWDVTQKEILLRGTENECGGTFKYRIPLICSKLAVFRILQLVKIFLKRKADIR